jgi:cell division protein FtsB
MALMVFLYRFLPETAKRREGTARVAELSEQIEQHQQVLARAMREADLLTRDPEYVALIARDRLDLAGPDEKVYRLESTRPAGAKNAGAKGR